MNDNDPYDMASKSKDELLRIITGRKPDTLDHQYAKIELEKRESASEQHIAPNKTTDTANNIHNPRKKPLEKIAIGAITFLIGACAIWVLNHYLDLGL